LQHRATTAPAPTLSVVADTVDRAVQLLALLQRDGRLVDFLMEDVTALLGCADRIRRTRRSRRMSPRPRPYVTLEAILDGREGEARRLRR